MASGKKEEGENPTETNNQTGIGKTTVEKSTCHQKDHSPEESLRDSEEFYRWRDKLLLPIDTQGLKNNQPAGNNKEKKFQIDTEWGNPSNNKKSGIKP